MNNEYKICVMGDGAVGKTAFTIMFVACKHFFMIKKKLLINLLKSSFCGSLRPNH